MHQLRALDFMTTVHLLHIPKTGGTAVRAALLRDAVAKDANSMRVLLHGHSTRLSDIPVGQRVIFGVRDPLTRFVSAFNSRLRCGRPRYDIGWSEAQARGFSVFPTASDLAEALTADDPDRRSEALRLIAAIPHTATPLSYWLTSREYLSARRQDLLYIYATETLDQEFENMKSLLALARDVRLPTDSITAHRALPLAETQLSILAQTNLREWYRHDFELFEFSSRHRNILRDS